MKKRTVICIILVILLCIPAGIYGYYLYGNYKISKIPALTFEEALRYTTDNNADAVITVGIIKNGETTYTVYGENGQVLPSDLHTYEIGSLTKTFTASFISKSIQDGKISLSDTIDKYLSLPEKKHYPTIEQLLTHTSGYKAYYFEKPMIYNFLHGRNDYCGITKSMLMSKIADINLKEKDYSFQYSNFGYAVLGLVLEAVYQEDYTSLMNSYIQQELKLSYTKISDGNGDLHNYWKWNKQDAYIPAGALVSNISDMLSYAKMQMKSNTAYIEKSHESLKVIDASSQHYKKMGIHMDEIGMSWITDSENNIIWHNGGTGDYNSYIGFNLDTQTAVVVLSNLSPDYRIPATILGIKLLQNK